MTIYNRTNHAGMHARGFAEEGTTTTPFDMVVLNELDRFHLAIEVIDRVPGLSIAAAAIKQQFRDALIAHYIRQHGEDMPQIRGQSDILLPSLVAACAAFGDAPTSLPMPESGRT